MARDPYTQREEERMREDDDERRQAEYDAFERRLEHAPPGTVITHVASHLPPASAEEIEAQARRGKVAAVGYDPADGGRVIAAPVHTYACDDHPNRICHVQPKAVKDQAGNVTAYHYPIADGPFCLDCGRLMRRVYLPGEVTDSC